MARKTKTGNRKTGTRKKKKKTATVKTAAETVEANDEQLPIDNCQLAIEHPPGIVCPRCGCRDLRAPDGRPWEIVKTEKKYGFVRRRRICRYCGRVVYTRERLEDKDS